MDRKSNKELRAGQHVYLCTQNHLWAVGTVEEYCFWFRIPLLPTCTVEIDFVPEREFLSNLNLRKMVTLICMYLQNFAKSYLLCGSRLMKLVFILENKNGRKAWFLKLKTKQLKLWNCERKLQFAKLNLYFSFQAAFTI